MKLEPSSRFRRHRHPHRPHRRRPHRSSVVAIIVRRTSLRDCERAYGIFSLIGRRVNEPTGFVLLLDERAERAYGNERRYGNGRTRWDKGYKREVKMIGGHLILTIHGWLSASRRFYYRIILVIITEYSRQFP